MFNACLDAKQENRSDYGEHVGQDSADAFPRWRPAQGHITAYRTVPEHDSSVAARAIDGRARLPQACQQQRRGRMGGTTRDVAYCRYAAAEARAPLGDADVRRPAGGRLRWQLRPCVCIRAQLEARTRHGSAARRVRTACLRVWRSVPVRLEL